MIDLAACRALRAARESWTSRQPAARRSLWAGMELPGFCSYIALVDSVDTSREARVSRRFPLADRPGLAFPPAVAPFAMSQGAARRAASAARPEASDHTAILTLEDGSRFYVVCSTTYVRAPSRASVGSAIAEAADGWWDSLRVSAVAAAGSSLAVATRSAELFLYRLRASLPGGSHEEKKLTHRVGLAAGSASTDGADPVPEPASEGTATPSAESPAAAPAAPHSPPAIPRLSELPPRSSSAQPTALPTASSSVTSTPRLTSADSVSSSAPSSHAAAEVVAIELGCGQCTEPPAAVCFGYSAVSSARVLTLAAGEVRLWSKRLRSSAALPLAPRHRATRLAVAHDRNGPCSIAVASTDSGDSSAPRAITVFQLADAAAAPVEARRLLLPASVERMEFCGRRFLCVAHPSE